MCFFISLEPQNRALKPETFFWGGGLPSPPLAERTLPVDSGRNHVHFPFADGPDGTFQTPSGPLGKKEGARRKEGVALEREEGGAHGDAYGEACAEILVGDYIMNVMVIVMVM